MIRLFFALNLKEQEILINLFNNTKKFFSNKNKIKWVSYDNLHITIFFIGEIQNYLANEIIALCNDTYSHLKAFSIEYKNNLVFYNNRKIPKIVGIEFKTNEFIIELKNATDNFLEKFDIQPEKRDFIPHLTFGRVKECFASNEFLKFENSNFIEQIKLNIDSFTLYKSTLTSNGSIYEPLWQIKF
jgi:2'-5' RNA ligase